MSLKKFEIQEMVAKGGMAEVYRAKTVGFQGFEKEVCVKKILPHLTEDDSFVQMFINEAKLAATLTYANIVSVHDLCVSASGEYFIVMEYVNGKDLSDVIRAAQLAGREVPPDVAVFICREVCKGLYYAHTKSDSTGASLNIIHRDISPHNVLVSFMGEVKITDFGIAKASSIVNKTAVGILKGKYGYMSPEQARGQPLDHRSDIFNTGIVLYELLVGERCFAGSSDFSTLNLMRNATVTPPTKINSHVTKELEAIVLRALAADRNDRFKDALDMEQALGRYAESRGKRVQVQELSTFMKELFSGVEESRAGGSTGVLSLASVVGPAVEDKKDVAENVAKPRRGTERAPELADQPISAKLVPPEDEPGREALERAKRRAEKKSEPPPEEKPKEAKAEAKPEPKPKTGLEKKKAEEPPKDGTAAKPERKPARIKPGPEAKSEVKADAKAEAKEAKEAKAEAKEAKEAKAEAKEAKAEKADKGEEKEKKKGKQLSDQPKKPVGRKELRPGLTMLQQMSRPQQKRTLVRALVIVLLALAIGAGVGIWRARQASRQRTFRDMELATRDPAAAKKPTVTVLITTEPPGATVLFDKIELSERTPFAVERDRDDKEHDVELSLDGFKTTKRTLEYEKGPVTRFAEKLSGETGTLKVASKPGDLPVKVDGKLAGNTPLSMDLPSGKREVEIGGGEYEVIKTSVEVRPGKTSNVSKKVPPKGSLGSLRITSEPQAQIFLDDEPTGRWTNDGALDLEPDVSHRVGLVVSERADKKQADRRELVVKLKKGEKRELYLDLTGPS